MDDSAPLHRFRTLETLHEGDAARLELARDIVEDQRCWVLTPVRPVGPVTETALWLRARSAWGGSSPGELRDIVRHGDVLHLSLSPVEARPYLEWFAQAGDPERRESLHAWSGFFREVLATGVCAGALDRDALWWSATDGPIVLPSAWMLPPSAQPAGRFHADHLDPLRCSREILSVLEELAASLGESGASPELIDLARSLRAGIERSAREHPDAQAFAELPEAPLSHPVTVIPTDTMRDDAAALADQLRARGLQVVELEPQIRVAREVRFAGPVDALILAGEGCYADFAVTLERLEKLGALSGKEAVYRVCSPGPEEEDMELWLRGRAGAAEQVVLERAHPDGESPVDAVRPGADHGGRVLEVLALLGQGVVADALVDAFSWSPRALAAALADLLSRDLIRIRYALHYAAPGLHVVVQLADGHEVELEASRREEVRALIGSIAERHPDRGRGIGRQWFYARLLVLARSVRATERLRRLGARLEESGHNLMSVGVYGLLIAHAEEAATREDVSRSAIVRAHYYQRAGQLARARQILDEAAARLGRAGGGAAVDEPLASVTLHRARLDFHASAFAEGEHRLSVLLEETRGELPVELRSRVYVELAWAQLQLGRTRESVRTSELVLRLLDAHTHAELVARAHTQLGFALYKESDYAGSVMHYDRALRLRKQIGDTLAVARTLNNLGLSYRALEQWNSAEESLRESLRLKAAAGDELSMAASLLNLGFFLLDRGQLDEAGQSADRCIEIGRRHHHPETEAEALGLLGEIARARGDLESAREWLLRDLEICERTGHESERLATLRRLAEVLVRSGEHEEAAMRLETARGLLSEQPSRLETALLDRIEADLLSHDEVFEPAITAYSAAARGFAGIQRPVDQVQSLARRGLLEHRLGRIDAARATLGELREVVSRHELPNPGAEARELESRIGSASPRTAARSSVGPRTCLEALVSALEQPDGVASVLGALAGVFDGAEVIWIGNDGSAVGPEGALIQLPDALGPRAEGGEGTELQEGWVFTRSRRGSGTLVVRMRRDPDPAEEQLLRGFLHVLERRSSLPAREAREVAGGVDTPAAGAGLVGRSAVLAHVLRLVDRVAPTDVSVLLLGENGTGKELVARALHDRGPRAELPFVAVNCASIPATLLESELFGHEKGAFTSAHARRAGRFEEAGEGTLLLDEIGEMPLEMQAKLLRVLQERTFTRVGGSEVLRCDARIIAATNRDLAAEVERGRFRMDLYYRINVVTIEIPPLRERREDIRPLVEHFVRKHGPAFGGRVPEISAEVLGRLEEWHWPGNVRELENVVMNALVFATSDVLRPEDLPPHILPVAGRSTLGEWQSALHRLLDAADLSADNPLLPRLEAWVVAETVRRTGNKTLAAKMLGITKPTVYDRLRRYDALYGPDEKRADEGVG